MDEQGIDKALMFPAAAHDIEYEFTDNIPALYANIRAFNRWMLEEVGYSAGNRMFLPPYIALADPDLAVQELERVIADGATIIQTKAGHAHGGADNATGGRSPADPVFDRFWSMVNEADLNLTVHLGGTDYQKYGADWSEDPETVFGDFDAFQWVMYWGDRPAMEFTAGLIFHNFFGRYPNIRVCLSEMGTVWLPYTLRKMDHAWLMGRKAKWSPTGRLDRRPSEIFRQHFIVAPYPEENVGRVVAEVGIEPIVFGSDFPHGGRSRFPRTNTSTPNSAASPPSNNARSCGDNLENFLTFARLRFCAPWAFQKMNLARRLASGWRSLRHRHHRQGVVGEVGGQWVRVSALADGVVWKVDVQPGSCSRPQGDGLGSCDGTAHRVGTSMAAPVLFAYGSEEQRSQWLPALARGEERWCQFFSEPDAGSDLAGVRTRAVGDADGWLVTGQKVWKNSGTLMADRASTGQD